MIRLPFLHHDRKILGMSKRDIEHHAVLVLILLIGVLMISFLSYSRYLQFAVGVTTSLLYIVWGYIHHKLEGDLYFKNMVEYVFIALLAVVIMGGIFL